MNRRPSRRTRGDSTKDPARQPAIRPPDGSAPPLQLLQTLQGRLVLLSGGILIVLFLGRLLFEPPAILELFRRVVALAFVGGAVWLAGTLLIRHRRELLWRVRAKLILSYVFLGVVPVVLVVTFALAGGTVLYNNVAAYLLHEGMNDVVDDAQQAAELTVADLARQPGAAVSALDRTYADLQTRYPGLSLALVPAPRSDIEPGNGSPEAVSAAARPAIATAGPWRHARPVGSVPAWAVEQRFAGLVAVDVPELDEEDFLLVRAVAPSADGRFVVVADLPVDTGVRVLLDDETGTRIRSFIVEPRGAAAGGFGATSEASLAEDAASTAFVMFSRTVVFMDAVADWNRGDVWRVGISLSAPVGRLYDRLVSVQPNELTELLGSQVLAVLAVLGVLFLVVQGAALIMGGALARSITYAVHELFAGTERIQRGDFAHRIRIESKDQLGALAGSFNRMSASIEHLLHVQREKQRLDEELRIAREIQKSLLPDEPPKMSGLSIADLCEPAREVGGDYYDFFVLGPRRLGVLIADVAGKGTSAALYMAELKGLMLALSHDEPSPRQLLVEVNRRLAGQLDNRSFITMTYAILDLDAGVLTHARAGHTPLITVSGGRSHVVQPEGMVVGLRLPGAEERFQEILEEHTSPLGPGDVVVLYTDGVTEAMDLDGELFGDAGLAAVLEGHHTLDAVGIRERVVREVRAFVGDAEQHDDMTMIVLKVASA